MDFGLSEEQRLLQRTLQDFVTKECPPARVREVVDGAEAAMPEIWRGLCDLGIGGLMIDEAFGGAGLGALDAALVAESLGAGAVPSPFLGPARAGVALAAGADAATAERLLPDLASGELIGAVAFGDEGGVWEPRAWTQTAEAGRVTGRWPFVPWAASADVLVVGTRGEGLALVEAGASGVEVEAGEGIDATRRLDRVELRDAPCVPLAAEGAAARTFNTGLALLAADAFGGASRLVEVAAEYASTRQQFGQPIAQFQSVKHQLANMATEVEPARGLFWYAAHALDALPDEAPRAAALAKAHLCDRYLDVARAAVEVHGGVGFTWDCDVQIWFKRALFDRAYLGTPELHRERCAAMAAW